MHALIIAKGDEHFLMTGAGASVVAAAGALNVLAGGYLVEAEALVRDGRGRDTALLRDMRLWGGGDGIHLLCLLRGRSGAGRLGHLGMREQNVHDPPNERWHLRRKKGKAKRWVAIYKVEDVCIYSGSLAFFVLVFLSPINIPPGVG